MITVPTTKEHQYRYQPIPKSGYPWFTNATLSLFRVHGILSILLIIQILMAFIYNLVKLHKRKNQVIQINLPSVDNQPFVLNNQAFNDDLVTWKELVVITIFVLSIICIKIYNLYSLLAKFISYKTKVTEDDIITCFIFLRRFLMSIVMSIAYMLFYCTNRKLRKFAFLFVSCRFDEI